MEQVGGPSGGIAASRSVSHAGPAVEALLQSITPKPAGPQPPSPDRFPAYPASWYLFCRSHDLRNKPVSQAALGRQLVGFRSTTGVAAVLDARCCHMGADLGRGKVVGDRLRCPFHGWEYWLDGRCVRIPATCKIPAFARQARYPVQERHGFVFVFNGEKPLFPLPFFADTEAEELAVAKPIRWVANCPWQMIGANAFDYQHFNRVHGREMLRSPEVDCPAPFARRIRFDWVVVGNSAFDRLLRRFIGSRVDVSITVWGGNFVVVTSVFRRVMSYIIFVIHPMSDGRTLINALVFGRRGESQILRALREPVSLWLRRLFTRAFVDEDINRIGTAAYRPTTFIESDAALVAYYDWVASLPPSPVIGGDGPTSTRRPVS